jgi:hypothetical protein
MSPKLSASRVVLAATILGGIGGLWMEAAIRVARNPPVIANRTIEAHLAVPNDIERIFSRSCKDCHSYETRWPWYSRLPVVAGVIGNDVIRARSYMNLSDWSATIAKGKGEEAAALNGICEELRSDSMPLTRYRRIHRHAHLTEAEVDIICRWTKKTAASVH